MKILVFELACANGEFETSILYEGFEMLSMIANGFIKAGCDVTVILNSDSFEKFKSRLEERNININIIEIQNSDSDSKNLIQKIINIARIKNIDFVFPIAPDSDLVEIAGELRLNNIKVIASETHALEIAADKWKTYEVFKRSKINTPKTRLFESEAINYPFIVKQRTGIACENLFKINNENEFKIFSDNLMNNLKINCKNNNNNCNNNCNNNFIIQEFVKGDNVSVTLFSDGKNAVLASLNKQNLKLSIEGSRYLGGIVPYEHPLKEDAFKLAKSAVESVSGLKGAVGVDLVLSDKPYVIEINPRVTTSMVALEKVSGLNIAKSALLAYNGELSEILSGISKINFKKNKNIIEFSHIFDDGESLGIEFKEIKT